MPEGESVYHLPLGGEMTRTSTRLVYHLPLVTAPNEAEHGALRVLLRVSSVRVVPLMSHPS